MSRAWDKAKQGAKIGGLAGVIVGAIGGGLTGAIATGPLAPVGFVGGAIIGAAAQGLAWGLAGGAIGGAYGAMTDDKPARQEQPKVIVIRQAAPSQGESLSQAQGVAQVPSTQFQDAVAQSRQAQPGATVIKI